MNMKLVSSCDTVDLCDDIIFVQEIGHLRQMLRCCFDLKIAGDRTADLLRVYDGRILFDDALFLQCLNPGFYGHAGNTGFLPDVRVRDPCVFDQKLEDLLIQCIQTVQIHTCPSCKMPSADGAFLNIIAFVLLKVNSGLTFSRPLPIIVCVTKAKTYV